jgi:eukaryotic-like serine/threonine-protein kinase
MTTHTCTICGCRIGPSAGGLCPACLLAGVLEHSPEEPAACGSERPMQVEQYEILGEIARGGMGVVYRAHDTRSGRTVAMKMLASAHFAGPDEMRRFRQEAEAVVRLDHANVVPVYEVGEFEGVPFFVMKLAQGTLRERAAPVANDAAAKMLLRIARAIQFAHEHGVLHRDLKPANILIDTDDSPMVCDFGLAQLRGQEGFTLTGAGIGTPAYMAPEQASGGTTPTTTLTDVYGLGALLYHQLTGGPPFVGEDTLAILRRLASEDPPHPRSHNDRADKDLAEIALKAMAKSPAERYRSAAAFADDLERWLRGEPTVARPAGAAGRIWKWARRKPASAVAAALTLVGAAALAAVFANGEIAVRQQRNIAQSAEDKARKEARHARESERAMRLNLYAADMLVASRALQDGHLGVARETLERQVPQPGAEDLRGFEWYAFHADCRGDDLRVLTAHERAVESVAFSPDGKIVASSGPGGNILFWDTTNGEWKQQWPRPDAPTGAMEIPLFAKTAAVSPDVRALLAANPKRFDELRMRWRPSRLGGVDAMAWTSDGKFLISGGGGSYIRVWEVESGDLVWFAPVTGVGRVEFTRDGATFVAMKRDGQGANNTVFVYDFVNRVILRTIENVRPTFALRAADRELVIARHDGKVESQNLLTGEIVASIDVDAQVVAASQASPMIGVIGVSGTSLSLWDIESGKHAHHISHPTGEQFRDIAISADGKTLAAVGTDQLVRIVDLATMTEAAPLRGHADEILSVRFSPTSSLIATGGKDGTARLWSASGKVAQPVSEESSLPIAATSPSGIHALFQRKDGSVECWNSETFASFTTTADYERKAAGFTADGTAFLTTRTDTQDNLVVEKWTTEAQPAGPPKMFPLPTSTADISAVSGAGNCVAILDRKRELRFYSLDTGKENSRLEYSRRSTTELGFSPNGRYLAAFYWPDRMGMWDVQRGTAMWIHAISKASVLTTAISPDSRFLASAGGDNVVSIFDITSGELIATLRGHKAAVRAIAFTPDGRSLASASADLTVRLWHVPTWRELGVLKRGMAISSLAFIGTPPKLVATGGNGRVVVGGRGNDE